MAKESYDVLIIGGGLAGAATAIALSQHWLGCRILLLEKQLSMRQRIGETLPPQAVGVLEQLNLWQGFQKLGFMPSYGSCALWDDEDGEQDLIENPFIYSPFGHGWHIDRQRFDDWILEVAQQRGVEVRRGVQVKQLKRQAKGLQVKVRNESMQGGEIQTKFIVDASGRKANFAQRLDASVKRLRDDQLICIAGYLQPQSTAIDSTTLVEACREGWWYTASLPDGRQMVALMTDADIAKEGCYKDPIIWQSLLAETKWVKKRLIDCKLEAGLNIYAADSYQLNTMTGLDWLAVGDAVSCFDPLSSLGMLKALRSGVVAAYALTDAGKGDAMAMRKYQYLSQQEYQGYLEKRCHYYAKVKQYAKAPFWRRRQLQSKVLLP